jgi:hypothetical protein
MQGSSQLFLWPFLFSQPSPSSHLPTRFHPPCCGSTFNIPDYPHLTASVTPSSRISSSEAVVTDHSRQADNQTNFSLEPLNFSREPLSTDMVIQIKCDSVVSCHVVTHYYSLVTSKIAFQHPPLTLLAVLWPITNQMHCGHIALATDDEAAPPRSPSLILEVEIP